MTIWSTFNICSLDTITILNLKIRKLNYLREIAINEFLETFSSQSQQDFDDLIQMLQIENPGYRTPFSQLLGLNKMW